MKHVTAVLVDRRNFQQVIKSVVEEVQAANFIGLDVETEDSNRHEGLNRSCKYNDDGMKAKTAPLVFDMQRTVITGFSIYCDGSDIAYYFNLNHADVENRLPWIAAKVVLDARKPTAYFIAHNAPYELATFGNSLGYEIERIICTLQMAVSTYGPDDYDIEAFKRHRLGAISELVPDLIKRSVGYDMSQDREPKAALAEIVNKITAKESDAAHSYNGWIKEIAWGYGLKQAVKSHFGFQMRTFEDTLKGKRHMGELTGEEVVDYGADDAYWAVRLFHHLLGMMKQRAPNAVSTFFTQEAPMVHIFADIWRQGCVINLEKVEEYRLKERENFAVLLRELKQAVLETGGFRAEPDPRLMKRESWYEKNHAKYRRMIWEWANSPDDPEPLKQCMQVRSPVSNAWADDLGIDQSKGVNLVHYMPQRTLLYDLLMLPLSVVKGKVQSDGECRGRLLDKARKQEDSEDESLAGWKSMAPAAVKVLECLNKMSSLEQRMKLYLTPYVHLTDRSTGRVYPVISSELATRRMAAKYPNGMQLAKRGESVYIRGVWEADSDEHVVFSRDWSAIELVIIGELSKDPEFAKVYAQTPHGDLHAGASSDILSVEVPELTEERFKSLKRFESAEDFCREWGYKPGEVTRLFTDLKGGPLSPGKAVKYWRTEIGKGANFNFWYSGWLGTVGDRMGWNSETTAKATERYTSRFWLAEQWRRSVIADGIRQGYVELPDGHRRYRYEAMEEWKYWFTQKFPLLPEQRAVEGFNGIVHEMARRIHKRSHNQLVNAVVQGTCATLAKRSMIAIKERCKQEGLGPREVRFLLPIHDELVYSVHKDCVVLFDKISRECMNTHPDLFPTLAVDSSPSIGLNFEPWSKDKSRLGQVELYEPPADIVGEELENTRLGPEGIQMVTDWLFAERNRVSI